MSSKYRYRGISDEEDNNYNGLPDNSDLAALPPPPPPQPPTTEPFDFDEEIFHNVIRKRKEPAQSGVKQTKGTLQPQKQRKSSVPWSSMTRVRDAVPLLLCDVERATIPDRGEFTSRQTYQIFGGSVHFRTCLIHARIVSPPMTTPMYYKYMIDDGTAMMLMYVSQRQKDMTVVQQLRNEVDAMRCSKTTTRNRQTINNLCEMLAKITENLDGSRLPLGGKVLVQGVPSRFYDVVSVRAYSVCSDDTMGERGRNRGRFGRDVEIAFKDYLIDWYTHHRPASYKR